MKSSNNPLNRIKIASPCSADWNEMFGNERRRFCSACQLNVYNLAAMTQAEAESLLINSENRVCLKVFRRKDGTVITQDCPVGLQKIKRRVSQLRAGIFTMIITFLGGISAFRAVKFLSSIQINEIREIKKDKSGAVSFGISDGMVENLPELKIEILKNRSK